MSVVMLDRRKVVRKVVRWVGRWVAMKVERMVVKRAEQSVEGMAEMKVVT